jgi:putative redox protein
MQSINFNGEFMKLNCIWNDKMKFTAEADQHKVEMDAKSPIGSDTALTPKQLLLAGISGCTGMDVVALLRKYKQPLEGFQIDADAVTTEGINPAVFKEVKLTYKFSGVLDQEKVLEAIRLSQTKYCGVSAMVAKAVPISYTVELNGKLIGTGQANFE